MAANGLSTSSAFAWETLSAFDEGWPVWTGRLGLLVLMLGLAATFSRRLSYGVWRWLHAGLAVAPNSGWLAGSASPFIGLLRSGPVGTATTLLYLYQNEADAAFLPELRAIAASDPRLSLQAVATGETLPDLERLLPDARRLSGTECYLCGPPGLIASLKSALRARGVAARNIHYENFEFR